MKPNREQPAGQMVYGGPPASKPPMTALPPGPQGSGGRCPATTQYAGPYSAVLVGVQCKYERGHDGQHAGPSGLMPGDIFWDGEAEGT